MTLRLTVYLYTISCRWHTVSVQNAVQIDHTPQAPMNTETQPLASDPLPFQPLRPSELANAAPSLMSWLWHGYLAPGKVTALVSPPKVGKTTLTSHLLARFAQGGQLAGLAVAPGRA